MEYSNLIEKIIIRRSKKAQILGVSLALIFLSAGAYAWPIASPDADDDPANPKKLRSDTPVSVKSTHFDVIAHVNSERGATECGLTPYGWPVGLPTDLTAGNAINAANINSIRAAVRQMYVDKYGPTWNCAGQFPVGTSGASVCEAVAPGDMVRKEHVEDIRFSFGTNFNTPNVCDLYPGVLTACGNGNINIGETCDDSNWVNEDGCSATCQCEYLWVDETCGGPTNTECPMSQMMQNGTSIWGPCVPTTQCVANPTCEDGGYEIKFDEEDMGICAFDASIFKVHATIVSAATPVRVTMSYYIVWPEDLKTEPIYEDMGLFVDPGVFNTGDYFKYKVPWPGVREADTVVEIHTGAQMYDAVTGEMVGSAESLDHYWFPWVCDAICGCGAYSEWGCGGEHHGVACAANEMMMGRDCNGGDYMYDSCKQTYCKEAEDSPTCVEPDCSACGPWTDDVCGAGGCDANQMKHWRDCTWADPACIDAECKSAEESPTCCTCSEDWVDWGCGGACAANEMKQHQVCTDDSCSPYRCLPPEASPSCA